MHVGRVEVGLLVPGRRRQDDVGVERRRVHAEVEVDDEIHLSRGRLLVPGDVLDLALRRSPRRWRCGACRGSASGRTRGPWRVAMSALPRQMNQTRGQFSGASGSSTANCELLRLQLLDDVRRRSPRRSSRPPRSASCATLERALGELRVERQPARCARRATCRSMAWPVAPARRRSCGTVCVVGEVLLVAPLVGVDVVPATARSAAAAAPAQSRAKAIDDHGATGASFSWPT